MPLLVTALTTWQGSRSSSSPPPPLPPDRGSAPQTAINAKHAAFVDDVYGIDRRHTAAAGGQ